MLAVSKLQWMDGEILHRGGFPLPSLVYSEAHCIFDKDENCSDFSEIQSRVNSIEIRTLKPIH